MEQETIIMEFTDNEEKLRQLVDDCINAKTDVNDAPKQLAARFLREKRELISKSGMQISEAVDKALVRDARKEARTVCSSYGSKITRLGQIIK